MPAWKILQRLRGFTCFLFIFFPLLSSVQCQSRKQPPLLLDAGNEKGKCGRFPWCFASSPRKSKGKTHTEPRVRWSCFNIYMEFMSLSAANSPYNTQVEVCRSHSGMWRKGASFLLNYIWQSSRKHMLPDNLPKVLMKDMGLIFPTTLRLCLCVCVCPWVNVLFVWVRFPSSPLTVSPFCQRLWASIFFDELEKSQCPCVGASVLGSGGIISIL